MRDVFVLFLSLWGKHLTYPYWILANVLFSDWDNYFWFLVSAIFIRDENWICQMLVCFYWEYYAFFLSYYCVNVVNYIDWFSHVDLTCIPKTKPHLVTVMLPLFSVFGFHWPVPCEDFWICVHEKYWPIIFLFLKFNFRFWYQSYAGLIKQDGKCFFLPWKSLCKIGIPFFLNIW